MLKISHTGNMLNNILLFICFIFIVYDPWFFQTLRGFIIGSGIILCICLIRKNLFINRTNLYLILLIPIFLFLSTLPTIYNYQFDFSVTLMYLRMLIYITLLYFLYILLSDKKKLIYFLKASIYLQFLIFIFCLLLPDFFKNFIFSVHTAESFFQDSEQGYRLYIFTSMAFFQLSLFFGFVFNFLLNLYLEKKTNLLPIIFCFICGMASGRSFIVFALISIFISGLNLKLMISLILGLILIYFIAINFQDNIYIYHALEPIIQYNSTQEVQTSSSDKLINDMLILPSDKQFLIGDGLYTNSDNSYYMHTDSGYLRQLFYGGFLYLLLCLGITTYIVKRVALGWFNTKKFRFFISTMCIFGIGNIKADVFMYPGITFFLLFLLAFYSKEQQ